MQKSGDEVTIVNDEATNLQQMSGIDRAARTEPQQKDAECKPLKNLDELFSWKSNDSDWSSLVQPLSPRSDYCYAGKDLQCHKNSPKPVKLLSASAPKTLICHDMMGGYLDDRFVNGSTYNDQYLFYHWSGIDIFVYFSHHFITIPPLMWINAAHNHGVRILGTLITEHTDGVQIWNEIFSDQVNQSRLVHQLVAIQKHYRFDGYLINIENPLTLEQLPKLREFLQDLKSGTEDGLVIWYDSVSFIDGKLIWQDQLNEHNQPAFDICDGIFLNYNWTSCKLSQSLKNAGVRLRDVYVGIDVFPRGRQEAGGFYTKDTLATVRSFGLSAAIFGFGWTHEVEAKVSSEGFFDVERRFWSQLLPHLYIRCPTTIPFRTRFNVGVASAPPDQGLRYDLSLQSFQLSLQSCLSQNAKRRCFGFTVNGCEGLSLNTVDGETEIHKLMLCHFATSSQSPLRFSVSARTSTEFRPFEVLLGVEHENRPFTVILCFSDREEYVLKDVDYSCSVALCQEINRAKSIRSTDNQWVTNSFLLKFDGIVTEVMAKIETPTIIGSLSFE